MNIFTVLNQGNSRLHETSMSAVLAYFLDSRQDHGLGDTFLRAFLQLQAMRPGVPANYGDLLAESTVELEKPSSHQGKNVFFDIEIALQDSSQKAQHYFIVENKINPAAAREYQLAQYYEAARADDERKDKPITVVFLTPVDANKHLQKEYDKLAVKSGDHKIWLYWKGERDEDESIQKAIRENILRRESVGEISPISEYVKHTLKAFAMHLDALQVSGTAAARAARRSRSAPPAAGSGENAVEFGGYKILKDGNKFLVRDKSGDKVPALPVFREFMEKLKIPDMRKGGQVWTTHTLGSVVLRKLKDLAARENEDADGNG